MATPNPSPNTNSPTKRPFGIIVAESYFVTFIALSSLRLIANLDFYTRIASRLHLHFFQLFARSEKISELIFGVLSVFAIVGLQRMRPWGRWLALVLATVSVGSVIWFYSAVLIFRLWTLVPHHVWPYVTNTIKLGFGIYVVWYLLRPKARRAFQPLQLFSAGKSDTDSQ